MDFGLTYLLRRLTGHVVLSPKFGVQVYGVTRQTAASLSNRIAQPLLWHVRLISDESFRCNGPNTIPSILVIPPLCLIQPQTYVAVCLEWSETERGLGARTLDGNIMTLESNLVCSEAIL